MPLFGGFAQARNFGKGGAGKPPGFITPAGSLGSLRTTDGNASSLLSAAATTGPGDPPITSYSIVSGSLPSGLSFNTTTAEITGIAPTVSSNTTYTFTVRATSSAGSIDREFSITIRLATLESFTTVGNFTWSVPSGVSEAQVLVVAGGGSGGHIAAGGGGGGVVFSSAYPVTPGGTVSGSVGDGGGPYSGNYPPGQKGENSSFGVLTAIGGGLGSGYSPTANGPGGSSGGGAGTGKNGPIAAAAQPQPSGVSPFTTAYGNAGGPGVYAPVTHWGAGGGGAGGSGNGVQEGSVKGGAGAYFAIFSSYGSPAGHFAGGGGGGQWTPHLNYPAANQAGGIGGGGAGVNNSAAGINGTDGTGGGGGGMGYPRPTGNNGGSGGVFIRY